MPTGRNVMDCILCKDKGYVMVKGYQNDKYFKVNCPYYAEGKSETKEAGSLEKKIGYDLRILLRCRGSDH